MGSSIVGCDVLNSEFSEISPIYTSKLWDRLLILCVTFFSFIIITAFCLYLSEISSNVNEFGINEYYPCKFGTAYL